MLCVSEFSYNKVLWSYNPTLCADEKHITLCMKQQMLGMQAA